MPKQDIFTSCYHGRQCAIYHMAYMRMRKVLLALHAVRKLGISLEEKTILDYGFGSGTFFRYCPASARLHGVEIDAQTVVEVTRMLDDKQQVSPAQLEVIDPENWALHPLLDKQYDFILCSHVLEHLPDPAAFLTRLKGCLAPGGIFLGIVPINERAANPHHEHQVDTRQISAWAQTAGLEIRFLAEKDRLPYWLQSLYTTNSGMRHVVAQTFSLLLGLPAILLGPRLWWRFSDGLGRLLRAKPTQAVFALHHM